MLSDTITAISTAPGTGGIAIIRISGPEAIKLAGQVFSGKDFNTLPARSAVFGKIVDENRVIDEVLITTFHAQNSFTGEDTVEISCHGSLYIQEEMLRLLIRKGARLARPGEFSLRAYLNKKIDLSQAEAIGDLIAADSAAAHRTAMQQMRGGYSEKIRGLRDKLIEFASLIELELDFSEEDVEFADRTRLQELLKNLLDTIRKLIVSFSLGNVIRTGIPVAITGAPNAGKSTLLNSLLQEDRALVSDIAGTTRDTVEEELILDGYKFRFIDTAGIRETADQVEAMGIQRTFKRMSEARIVIYLFDPFRDPAETSVEIKNLKERIAESTELILCANKADQSGNPEIADESILRISAKTGLGIDELQERLLGFVRKRKGEDDELMVTNLRHYEALQKAATALEDVQGGFGSQLSSDLIAIDLRAAISSLGEITGEITPDDILGSVFSRFCIGK